MKNIVLLSFVILFSTIWCNAQSQVLIPKGSTWKYLDDGSDQGTNWRNPSFDDSQWPGGLAKLGYGDGNEQTVLSYGPDANNKFITYYFRHSFNISSLDEISAFEISLLRDDAAVVYINGAEAFRDGMPTGTITYTTRAANDAGGSDETTYFKHKVSKNLFKKGNNVIAVEIHQIGPTSSDIGFDLQLKAIEGALVDGIFTYYFHKSQKEYIDSIRPVLNEKAHFYKKVPFDIEPSYNVKLCKDLLEFNANKPTDLATYDAGYYLNDTIYLMAPTTTGQKQVFSGIVDVAKHTFGKTAIHDQFDGNTAGWMEYGFGRMEVGLLPDTSSIKQQYGLAGRMPTVSEMMSGNLPSGQDYYEFTTVMVQFLIFKFGRGAFEPYSIQINGQNVNFNYWSIKSESDFEKVWLDFTKLFYLNGDVIKAQKPSPNFEVWMTDKDMLYYDTLVPHAEYAVSSYRDSLDIDMYHRLQLIVYPTKCEYQKSAAPFPCDPNSWSIGGGVDIAIFQMVSPADIDQPMENMVTLLKHELAHVAQFNIKSNFMPAWLSEGFAVFMPGGRLGQEDIVYMRPQLLDHLEELKSKLGHYPTMSELEDYGFVSQNNIDYYLIGQAMVDWLVKNWGFDKLRSLILSDGQNVGIYGFSNKQEFMDAFYQWIKDFWEKELYVQVPEKGDEIIGGSKINISWKAKGLSNISIAFSYDAGKSWADIDTNVTASTVQYKWVVPDIVSDSCLVLVKSLENKHVFDYSDTFSIIQSTHAGNGLITGSSVKVFPNPVKDVTTIYFEKGNTTKRIKVLDVSGRTIYESAQIESDEIQLNCSSWAKGIYFIRFCSGDKLYYLKFMKE